MNKKHKEKYFGKDLEAMFYAKNYYKWLIKMFSPYIGKDLIEVGAGSGTFSEVALTLPFKSFTAIEPSKNMYPHLKDSLSGRENVSTVNSYLKDYTIPDSKKKPDTFFYVNVLEHVQHDKKELELVYKNLKKGGHVCIFVPALPFLYGTFDKNVEHFRRYKKKQLIKLLEEAGFLVEKIHYVDFIGILPWFIQFRLLKRETLRPTQVKIYDEFVVPVLKRIESTITPPIGKNLLIVGKK